MRRRSCGFRRTQTSSARKRRYGEREPLSRAESLCRREGAFDRLGPDNPERNGSNNEVSRIKKFAYSDGAQGGRPPFDPVMMFKVLVIQTTNNLSDERAEFLINDRLSFMRFLGLGLSDRISDARTIWLFRRN